MTGRNVNLICPACGTDMKTIYIPTIGFYVEVCSDGCGGIFFDNREFKRFDEQHEDASVILNEFIGKKFEKTDASAQRVCPCCNAIMVKNFSSINKEIEIDECYNCGGKFLDNGELEKIRGEYLNEDDRKAHFEEVFCDLVAQEKENENEQNV